MRLAVAALALLLPIPDEEVLVLKGGRICTVSGGDVEDGAIVVQGGKIKAVGKGIAIPAGARVIDLPKGSVVVPGFIDGHSHLGSAFEIEESTESVTPHVKAVEGFASTHADVRAALSSGVTLVALAPGNGNLVGGRVGLVRLNGGRYDRMVFRDAAALKLSLGDEALRRDREPTSRTGAVRMLRELLGDPRCEVARTLLEQRAPALIHARQAADILRALEFKASAGLRAAIVHGDEAARVADRLREAGVAVAFGPLTAADRREKLETPARLARAGVRLAFVSDAPATSEDQLRVTAALAVRYGLDRREALRALTLGAADVLGVADRVGSLEVGKDADLVVYGGDPLSLASPIEIVIVEGKVVFRRTE